jgi:hypothetical protein
LSWSCTVYFVCKILKLHDKKFHGLMLIAIIGTSLTGVADQSLKLNIAIDYTTEWTESLKIRYDVSSFLSQVYFSLEAMLHTVFVSKYWSLSKKLESLLNSEAIDDQK